MRRLKRPQNEVYRQDDAFLWLPCMSRFLRGSYTCQILTDRRLDEYQQKIMDIIRLTLSSQTRNPYLSIKICKPLLFKQSIHTSTYIHTYIHACIFATYGHIPVHICEPPHAYTYIHTFVMSIRIHIIERCSHLQAYSLLHLIIFTQKQKSYTSSIEFKQISEAVK